MNNSIWKMPDVKPKSNNDIVCKVGALSFSGYYEKYNDVYVEYSTGKVYTPDEIDRWAYLLDIIAPAKRVDWLAFSRLKRKNR